MPMTLLKLKSRKARRSVGLDIGFHSIKMVTVEGGQGHLTLLHSTITLLNRVSETSLPVTDLRRALANTIAHNDLDLSDLRISVSGKGAIVRHTDMPRMSASELKSSIRYEADMLLPFSIEECVFDCHILDPDMREKPRMRVVLAAARKALVQERLELLKGIGLVPRMVSVDAISLANAFEATMQVGSDETVSVLHVGAARTILNIFSAHVLEFTRDIELGGDNATLGIARGLGIEFKDAERRKEASDASVKEMVASMITVLVRELRSTFNYVSSKMNKSISRVYLSGGGALCSGLKETLTSEFGIPVLFWDPLARLSSSPAQAQWGDQQNGIFAVAAGLAMSE